MMLRMLEDIIGRENIDQGIQNYLNRYDGRAVTINEFLDEVRKCQAFDLDKFKRWYHQIGTPQVKVSTEYDGNKNLLKLKLRQSPPGNFQDNKPVLMPVKMRLWSQKGDLIVGLFGQLMATINVVDVDDNERGDSGSVFGRG